MSIKSLVEGIPYTRESIGKSGAEVRMYPGMVLKIGRTDALREESAMLTWLEGKLPVPRVLAFESEAEPGMSAILMTRIHGDMACSEALMENPTTLMDALGEAFDLLRHVECPKQDAVARDLERAEQRVLAGQVDVSEWSPRTISMGFTDPERLLSWLEMNRPATGHSFSHGDLCLPNILVEHGHVAGFIDLGSAGAADLWRDLALCERSIEDNFSGKYSRKPRPLDSKLFWNAVALEPDRERMNYYLLLDELL